MGEIGAFCKGAGEIENGSSGNEERQWKSRESRRAHHVSKLRASGIQIFFVFSNQTFCDQQLENIPSQVPSQNDPLYSIKGGGYLVGPSCDDGRARHPILTYRDIQ